MRSNISVLILGLIAEKPINPYDVKKIFNSMDFIKKDFSISPSAIFASINRLAKRKYIEGKKVKSGNRPDKTIYTITETGEKVLRDAVTDRLRVPEKEMSKFDVMISLLCHLEKGECLKLLAERQSALEKEIRERTEDYREVNKLKIVPYTGLTQKQHKIYLREAELRSTKALIEHVRNDDEWSHYPAIDHLDK